MASVFQKGDKLYMSWYDQVTKTRRNKSLRMTYSESNYKKAVEFAKKYQKVIDDKNKKFKQLAIKQNTIQEVYDRFLAINSNKDPKTIHGYHYFWGMFKKYFDLSKPASTITKIKCEDWLISLRKTNYSQNTLAGVNKNLKKFLRFLFEYNYTPHFFLNRDVTFKPEVKDIDIFTDEDIVCFIKGLEKKNNNFKTTFLMLLYTGLRPTDIYKIKVEDINIDEKKMKYYSQKIRQYKEVPLHQDLIPVLKTRIRELKSGALINYYDVHNIGRAYREYLREIKLNGKGYTLRTFRKTFVSLAHNSGIDLATVSKLAGHTQITTTEKYYNRLSLAKKQSELSKLVIPKPEKTEVQTEVQFPLPYLI